MRTLTVFTIMSGLSSRLSKTRISRKCCRFFVHLSRSPMVRRDDLREEFASDDWFSSDRHNLRVVSSQVCWYVRFWEVCWSISVPASISEPCSDLVRIERHLPDLHTGEVHGCGTGRGRDRAGTDHRSYESWSGRSDVERQNLTPARNINVSLMPNPGVVFRKSTFRPKTQPTSTNLS